MGRSKSFAHFPSYWSQQETDVDFALTIVAQSRIKWSDVLQSSSVCVRWVTLLCSSPTICNAGNSEMFKNNLVFAASILLSGNNFYKIQQLCKISSISSPTTYFLYQRLTMCPTVKQFYEQSQVQLCLVVDKDVFFEYIQDHIIQGLHGKSVVLSGDGRCDSPGKCAKYCTYSLMDISSNEIAHVETIDKREVHLKSPNMEWEALSRGLKYLESKLNITEVTTDSSTSVSKLIGNCIVYIVKLCMFPLQLPIM